MTVEFLKTLKEHFEILQQKFNEENEHLKKLYEDKEVLNYVKLCNCFNPNAILDLKYEEDIMSGVLVHHHINKKDDGIYIDNGTYLVTSTNPQGIKSSLRLIKESDLEYVINIIKNNTNPLVTQYIWQNFIGLESGCCCDNVIGDNKTVIKLPSLLEKESKITTIESDNELKFNSNCESYSKESLQRFSILRAQFFLRMIKENPEFVLEYYRNPDNWSKIDEDVDTYYMKKQLYKQNIIEKIVNK